MGLHSERVHADTFALPGGLFESNLAIDKSKQRVIAAHSHVAARFDHRAALTHQHRASPYYRAVAALDAESLALGVAAVARATNALLVCHIAVLLLCC